MAATRIKLGDRKIFLKKDTSIAFDFFKKKHVHSAVCLLSAPFCAFAASVCVCVCVYVCVCVCVCVVWGVAKPSMPKP